MTITRFSTGAIRDNALATNTSFAASDMELIGTVRVGSGGVSSVTFSNIPQEYKHLQIRYLAKSSQVVSTSGTMMRINNDSGNNYGRHALSGNGSSATSTVTLSFSAGAIDDGGPSSSQFVAGVVDVLDYTNSSKNKTVKILVGCDNNGSGVVALVSFHWLNTAAVSSLTFFGNNLNSVTQFSKFSLYGIRG